MSSFDLSPLKQLLTEIDTVPSLTNIKTWYQLLIYVKHKDQWSQEEVIQIVRQSRQILLPNRDEEYSYIS